jgi:predicted HTH domain antitoxin
MRAGEVTVMAEMVTPWLYRQFDRLAQMRPDIVEPVLQRAMREDAEFRWAMVVGAYLEEQINLGKAAELLGMHRAQLQRQFLEKGIPLRLGSQTVEEAQAEVEAWAMWIQGKDR